MNIHLVLIYKLYSSVLLYSKKKKKYRRFRETPESKEFVITILGFIHILDWVVQKSTVLKIIITYNVVLNSLRGSFSANHILKKKGKLESTRKLSMDFHGCNRIPQMEQSTKKAY